MSNVPGEELYVQQESIQTREPNSESLFDTIGRSINFLLLKMRFRHAFKMNGSVKFFEGKLGVDGVFDFEDDVTLLDVMIYSQENGTSGNTTLDLKRGSSAAAFVSVLTQIPSVNFSAANFIYATTTSAPQTGVTPPVLDPAQVDIDAGECLRMDPIACQSGSRTAGLVIRYKKRSN